MVVLIHKINVNLFTLQWGRRVRDRMIVGFITAYAISAYYNKCCALELHSWRDVPVTILYEKVYSSFLHQ